MHALNRAVWAAGVLGALAGIGIVPWSQRVIPADVNALAAPRRVVVYRSGAPMSIDGRLDEPVWRAVAWSEAFVDIEGDRRPHPQFLTRQKMVWDDEYLYVAAEMEEPDLWGTLTQRDSVIFQDNDFEVFIDPDGDTHDYYELEVNVLGTEWDLMLGKPYRDGGPARNEWDMAGLRVGVNSTGTVNQPEDRDQGWAIEIAMPWSALREYAPGRRRPRAGEQWRINFSRVQWQLDVVEGRYVKRRDRTSGQPMPEDNWVWSPQGAINMHMPERWGYAQFSATVAGSGLETFQADPHEGVTWALRQLYYRQREFKGANGRYATSLAALSASDIRVAGTQRFSPSMQSTGMTYEITAPGVSGAIVRLTHDGRVWVE